MNSLAFAVTGLLFSVSVAFAQSPSSSSSASNAARAVPVCEAKPVGKNGKALWGAAKTSFLKRCKAESTEERGSMCAEKAVIKTGKPLTGAAKSSFKVRDGQLKVAA
jgi:hypothetical protein